MEIKGQPTTADDGRRARILAGAMQVFLAYGFQRTTMDDIARAAEISRPALYLAFRNKSDIYRALAADFLEDALANARASLAKGGSLSARLLGAVSCVHDKMREIEASPHGADILDMRNSLAGDLVTAGRTQFREMFEKAIAEEQGGRELANIHPPRMLAELLLDAIDGMKLRGLSGDEQMELAAGYVAVVAEAARK